MDIHVPRADFAGVSFDEGREDSVGECKLGKILRHVIFHLVRFEAIYKACLRKCE